MSCGTHCGIELSENAEKNVLLDRTWKYEELLLKQIWTSMDLGMHSSSKSLSGQCPLDKRFIAKDALLQVMESMKIMSIKFVIFFRL